MIICNYFIQFIFYSFLGWVHECLFVSIQHHEWSNRGFLYGPLCPIYGAGVIATLFCVNSGLGFSDTSPLWQIFLVCAAGSAVLEFGTSYVLEKLFHATWWDYSSMPFNIQGRICLPYTCCFGLAGIAIVKWLLPWSTDFVLIFPVLLAEALAMLIMRIMSADLALSVNSLLNLSARLDHIEKEFNERAQGAYTTIASGPEEIALRMNAIREQAESINWQHLHHLHSIRTYRTPSRAELAHGLKDRVREAREGAKEAAEKLRAAIPDISTPAQQKPKEEEPAHETSSQE